jgi:hypothetical protein
MIRRTTKNWCWAVALLAMPLAGAYASPTDTTVEIDYRHVVETNRSEVVFRVTLHLTPVSYGTDYVSWQIESADFGEPLLERSWSTGALEVSGASGGLWTLAHADPDHPTESEFTKLPSISGVADSNQSETDDLEFSLTEGYQALAPEQMPYGTQTAFSTHNYKIADEEESEEEDDDEPVIVHWPSIN